MNGELSRISLVRQAVCTVVHLTRACENEDLLRSFKYLTTWPRPRAAPISSVLHIDSSALSSHHELALRQECPESVDMICDMS